MPRIANFIQTYSIVREFKQVGLQMLIFNHKMPDIQQNSLLIKAILGYSQLLPQAESNSEHEQSLNLKKVGPMLNKRIPVFLLVLPLLFPMEEIRNYLVESNQMGQTPLHYAAKNGLDGVAEFLINDCKVDVNLVNKMGNSPLHVAVLNRRMSIVQMLVQAKVDVLIENKEGFNCLQHAQKMEQLLMCEYLDPIVINAEIWRQKNCLVKIMVCKEGTKFKNVAEGVFREILKYA